MKLNVNDEDCKRKKEKRRIGGRKEGRKVTHTMPLKRALAFLQESLNCFIMFDIFSNLCTSACITRCFSSQCAITRNVVLSKITTSSAPQISLNCFRCSSRIAVLGTNEYTICDQARYSVSSQMLLGKHRTFKSSYLELFTKISFSRARKTASRSASGIRSIL